MRAIKILGHTRFMLKSCIEDEPIYSTVARSAYSSLSKSHGAVGSSLLLNALILKYDSKIDIDVLKNFVRTVSLILSGGPVNETDLELNADVSNRKLISAGGFGYSGSSAIVDFLTDFSSCQSSNFGREVDFIKYDYGLADLHRRVRNSSLSEIDVIKFIFLHVFGIPCTKFIGHLELQNNLVNSKCIFELALRSSNQSKLLEINNILLKYFGGLFLIEDETVRLEKFIQGSRALISKISNFGTNSNLDCAVVINNWMPAEDVDFYECMPEGSVVLVVGRCWRDSYVSWCQEASGVTRRLGILYFFVATYIRYSKFRKFTKHQSNECRDIKYIKFENFVLNENERKNLLKILNIRLSDIESNRFNPSDSCGNINIFKLKRSYFHRIVFLLMSKLQGWGNA